ncbi:MAG: TadE/TadG family type IV pilus assembly protein [Pirellulaceae bacterium]|nr:TadE/TadG family type IV pilus assembly protein [Pirellulaceae bacterium]
MRFQNTTRRHRRHRVGSALSVELVMVLPILLIILLAFVEFGLLLMATQGVGAAANLGAREAALASSTELSVKAAADDALAGWVWQGKHEVVIFVNGTRVNFSDASDLVQDAPTGSDISVTVNVPMVQAAPNLLAYFGIDLTDKDLTTTYVTRKE